MNGMLKNVPSLTDLEQYNVNRPGATEVVRQTLYDFQAYPAAGSTQLTFFQLPVGQGGKTYADTNMESAGQLPSPKRFLVQSIEVHFFSGELPVVGSQDPDNPNVNANDLWVVGISGYLKFFIGSKDYLTEAPLLRFPPKCSVQSDVALSDSTTAAASNLVTASLPRWGGRPYMLQPPILLQPTQNFNVTLNWPALVPTNTGSAGRIGVVLDGLLYRNSQ